MKTKNDISGNKKPKSTKKYGFPGKSNGSFEFPRKRNEKIKGKYIFSGKKKHKTPRKHAKIQVPHVKQKEQISSKTKSQVSRLNKIQKVPQKQRTYASPAKTNKHA